MREDFNWRAQLRVALGEYFDESDLRTIAFDLGLDLETISGDNKLDRVIGIIAHFEKSGQINRLIAACKRQRPNVEWDEIAEAAKSEHEKQSRIQPQRTAPFSNNIATPQTVPARRTRWYVLLGIFLFLVILSALAFLNGWLPTRSTSNDVVTEDVVTEDVAAEDVQPEEVEPVPSGEDEEEDSGSRANESVDENAEENFGVYGWTRDDFLVEHSKLRNEGWRLHLLDVFVVNGVELYSAIWRKGNADETFGIYGWARDDFVAEHQKLRNEGWKLHILETFVVNGQELYSVVWRKSNVEEDFGVYGYRRDDFLEVNENFRNNGWRLHVFDVFVVDGVELYSGAWRKSNAEETSVFGWTRDDFIGEHEKLRDEGWRLYILEAFVVNGVELYSGVWRKTGGEEAAGVYGWMRDDFLGVQEENFNRGRSVDQLDVFVVNGVELYSAVWSR